MEVKIISPELTHSLRHRVLWPHIEHEDLCIIDIDQREDAIHLGTFAENQLMSIGSLFAMKSLRLSHEKQYRLRAMATDPKFRGTGSGKLLAEFAIEILRSKEIEVLWCDARLKATGFYERLGFAMMEDVYEVPLIGPHQFMYFELWKI
jgi:GNAT superfamily N-acetyltransferase